MNMGIRDLQPTYEIDEILRQIAAIDDADTLEILRGLVIEESTQYTANEWFIIDERISNKLQELI